MVGVGAGLTLEVLSLTMDGVNKRPSPSTTTSDNSVVDEDFEIVVRFVSVEEVEIVESAKKTSTCTLPRRILGVNEQMKIYFCQNLYTCMIETQFMKKYMHYI